MQKKPENYGGVKTETKESQGKGSWGKLSTNLRGGKKKGKGEGVFHLEDDKAI